MRAIATLGCALVAAAQMAGCGGEEKFAAASGRATEPSDPPAAPPRGWRSVANRASGFSVSAPRSWTVRTRGHATLLRSRDRLLAVTVAADRGPAGRQMAAAAYARRAFQAVPGFRGLRGGAARPVRGSPYESAAVAGAGTLGSGGRRQRQRVVVATFRRPGRVSYTAVAFGALVRGRAPHVRALRTLLVSLRGRRPAA